MPEISRFFGLKICMYPDDHYPPHFHVLHSDGKAMVGIDPVEVLQGELSCSDLALVKAWASKHKPELRADWAMAKEEHKQPIKIQPLR